MACIALILTIFDVQAYKEALREPIKPNWGNFYICCIMFSCIFSVFNHKKQ